MVICPFMSGLLPNGIGRTVDCTPECALWNRGLCSFRIIGDKFLKDIQKANCNDPTPDNTTNIIEP